MQALELLPYPREVRRRKGFFKLPKRGTIRVEEPFGRDPELRSACEGFLKATQEAGVELQFKGGKAGKQPSVRLIKSEAASKHPQGYFLVVGGKGVELRFRENAGLRNGMASLRQMVRQFGGRLPHLRIADYPDFERRGVMLDISRGRVPKLKTLLELAEHLASFKINELQLYTEHTFAYRGFERVWRDGGALTAEEVQKLERRCRELGIELVPNQNSFGHLRAWLEYPPLKNLGEIQEPYEDGGGTFLRYPSTLAPNHPGTLPFLRGLYDELLPNFTSKRFNTGCDETWDLGRGQSREICARLGKGRVYVDFLKKIHREVSRRGRRMMFWGDIILQHPELIKEIPKDCIGLNWGYEKGHPFGRETRLFKQSGLTFYVCPGTSSWMTLIGRHDNTVANLEEAAKAGRKYGAEGYLNTDWGDGGHPQPLAVSYLPYVAGAALSWCAASFRKELLVPVLSRDIFADDTQHTAKAALALGLAHRKFKFGAPNLTPFGAVIAAPKPGTRELFCRDGLKYFSQIPGRKVQAALREVKRQRKILMKARPKTAEGRTLQAELEVAARMAEQSCKYMLWQQTAAAGKAKLAKELAQKNLRELAAVEKDFRRLWRLRNKGRKFGEFFGWRREEMKGA